MVRDVAAPSGFVHLDAARGELIRGREDVGPTAVAADAERQDVRVLDEQQEVAGVAGLARRDEIALQRKRLGVRHQAKPTNQQ